MYVCMYVCMYLHTNVCMYACMYEVSGVGGITSFIPLLLFAQLLFIADIACEH